MENETSTTVETKALNIARVSSSALPVIKVNHGDVWGRKDGSSWYTFYCPSCKRQLETKADCPHCKQVVDWSV